MDYCGIALLTMGSFVPWLYYSFYCRIAPKIAYLVLIFVLGTCCIVVSLWDKFAEPEFRGIRAGMYIEDSLIICFHILNKLFETGIEIKCNKKIYLRLTYKCMYFMQKFQSVWNLLCSKRFVEYFRCFYCPGFKWGGACHALCKHWGI